MSIQLKKQLFPDAETHETLPASRSDGEASSPTAVHTVSHRANALTYLHSIRVSRDTYNWYVKQHTMASGRRAGIYLLRDMRSDRKRLGLYTVTE